MHGPGAMAEPGPNASENEGDGMKNQLLFAAMAFAATVCPAQTAPSDFATEARGLQSTVRTVAAGVGGDHILVHEGHLLLSTGTSITRTTLTGTSPQIVASGFAYAACKVVDRSGQLTVVDFGANRVVRVRPDGSQLTLASGLLGPVGCALDSMNRLYVAEARLGSTPGTRVYRTNAQGVLAPWVDLAGSPVPLIALAGLAIDAQDRVYVANYVDGRIARIARDGRVALFADLGIAPAPGAFAVSYLAFAKGDLYATNLSGNRLYRVTPAGAASVAAGTGQPGANDGPALTATFNLPNGVAATPLQFGVYITEAATGSLRLFIALRDGPLAGLTER